jgi:phage tail-like protein
MSKWIGRGGGRAVSQPNVQATGGPGSGGGRAGGQPTITNRSNWEGAGGGRAGGQPTLGEGNTMNYQEPSMGGRITTSLSWSDGDSRTAAGPATVDPEGNFYFALEIKGVEVAQFLECSGLKSSTEIFELQEGGMNHRVHKLPGQSRWENLQLRYGVTSDVSLLAWRNEVLTDNFSSRRTGSIVIKNNQGEAVRRYSFVDAWPVSWEGPSLSASGAELAIEMIELAHSGISVG